MCIRDRANCVRAFLGETVEEANGEILELVCNVDDMTPEALSFAASRLLEAGALDVYTLPGTMKKGRPGHVLSLIHIFHLFAQAPARSIARAVYFLYRLRPQLCYCSGFRIIPEKSGRNCVLRPGPLS